MSSVSISDGLLSLLALLSAQDAPAIDMDLPGIPVTAEILNVDAGLIQPDISFSSRRFGNWSGDYGPLLVSYGRLNH